MNKNDIIAMSSQERDRLDVINRIKRGELTQVNGAMVIGVTDRHMRRLIVRHSLHGDNGLVSNRRGQRSNRAYSEDFKATVINIVKDKYYDFGPTLAAEKLLELNGIKVNHETLRIWMAQASIYKTKARARARIHQTRDRRECFGELVQIDGSHHDWFEGRSDKCCLIVFIDDATGVMYCRFEEAETTHGYFRATKDYIDTYGKPLGFYSDKFGVFRVNHKCAEPNETQFQRAMRELNITLK